MSSSYDRYSSVEGFLDCWGEPCSLNLSVSYSYDTDDKKVFIKIAQPRRSRFVEVEIDCTDGVRGLNKWKIIPLIIENTLNIK